MCSGFPSSSSCSCVASSNNLFNNTELQLFKISTILVRKRELRGFLSSATSSFDSAVGECSDWYDMMGMWGYVYFAILQIVDNVVIEEETGGYSGVM